MTLFKKPLQLVALAAGLYAFSAQPAGALTISLSTGNPGISGFPGPYGTVGVTQTDSTHATILFTALDSPNTLFSYLFGAQGAAGVNVNAGSFSVSSASCTATFSSCSLN